eukprot:CCRYP_020535-RA/>CCRYP_020535-RA protein AED:0.03 eAED:0.03 QI:168/1/1/1/1/1/2/649/184
MGTIDEGGTKGNKKGRPLWTFVKNTSLLITVLFFVVVIVLTLDAYKFVSFRHAKFARKKLLTTLQYMDPAIIESHTGMKVLPIEEYNALTSSLSEARSQVRTANSELQEKYSDTLKASVAVQNVKKDIEDLKKLEAEKAEEDKKAAEAAAKVEQPKEEEKTPGDSAEAPKDEGEKAESDVATES